MPPAITEKGYFFKSIQNFYVNEYRTCVCLIYLLLMPFNLCKICKVSLLSSKMMTELETASGPLTQNLVLLKPHYSSQLFCNLFFCSEAYLELLTSCYMKYTLINSCIIFLHSAYVTFSLASHRTLPLQSDQSKYSLSNLFKWFLCLILNLLTLVQISLHPYSFFF